jgi:hypothetical protein
MLVHFHLNCHEFPPRSHELKRCNIYRKYACRKSKQYKITINCKSGCQNESYCMVGLTIPFDVTKTWVAVLCDEMRTLINSIFNKKIQKFHAA